MRSSATTATTEHPGLSPTAATPTGAQRCGARSSRCTAATPRQLEALKEEWWTDDSQTETLSALAVWRAELDDTGQDPREELAFQNQLADYAQLLRQQGGGVTKAWKPSVPPEEWIAE
jgi:hypothetical protein